MKYIFSTLLLITSIVSKGQNDYDSLAKYSYLIVGYKDNKVYQNGTGFFLKTDEGYRFITAKHVVSEMNTFTKLPTPHHYDFIGIVYKDTITNKSAFIRLDIRQVKPLLPNTFFYESPDVVTFNLIGMKLNIAINSIEKFLPNPKNRIDKKLEKIIVYGYANDTTAKDIDNVKPYHYEGQFADFFHRDPYYPSNDSINWVIQPESKEGISGSPVFLKYSKNANGKKVVWFEFGGVQFGNDLPYHSAYMVRQDTAIKELFKPTIFTYNF